MENIYGYVKKKNETAHVIASQGCFDTHGKKANEA